MPVHNKVHERSKQIKVVIKHKSANIKAIHNYHIYYTLFCIRLLQSVGYMEAS